MQYSNYNIPIEIERIIICYIYSLEQMEMINMYRKTFDKITMAQAESDSFITLIWKRQTDTGNGQLLYNIFNI